MPDEPTPLLFSDAASETPLFFARLALEAYRERLIRTFDFLGDCAAGRRDPAAGGDDGATVEALVGYLLAGEAAFVAARDAAREHVARYAALEARERVLRQRAAEVRRRSAALQAARAALSDRLFDARQLRAHFAAQRRSPLDGLEASRLALMLARGLVPPPTWRPGAALDDDEVRVRQGLPAPLAGAAAAAAAAEADMLDEGEDEDGGAGVRAGAAPDAIAGEHSVDAAARTADLLPPGPAPPPLLPSSALGAPTLAAAMAVTAPSAAAGAIAVALSSSDTIAAAAPCPLAPPPAPRAGAHVLSLLLQLPPAMRAELLRLFPAGWRPGDALPASLTGQDPRALLARLAASTAAADAAAGAGAPP